MSACLTLNLCQVIAKQLHNLGGRISKNFSNIFPTGSIARSIETYPCGIVWISCYDQST